MKSAKPEKMADDMSVDSRPSTAEEKELTDEEKEQLAKLQKEKEQQDLVDPIIEKLLAVRSQKPGSIVDLAEHEIRTLCSMVSSDRAPSHRRRSLTEALFLRQAKEIFLSEPCLLKLSAPNKLVGDIHGQYYDLLRVFEYCGFPPECNYLFMGDYVDRGKQGLECICLLAQPLEPRGIRGAQ